MTHQPNDIKKFFQIKFRKTLSEEPILRELLFEVFIYGTAYIVGGYFRDFLNNKESRDIDIIIDLENIKLLDIIDNLDCNYTKNRHGGIKIELKTITVDLWSLENNWAFKNELVKLNENDKLNSIAKGCFFNYDSLVINLHNYTYNTKYYKDFITKKELDILQKSSIYKNLNPTIEANIIRAFYVKQKINIIFSDNLIQYIAEEIALLNSQYEEGIKRILDIKLKYPKYKDLTNRMLIKGIQTVIDNRRKFTNDLFLYV